MIKISLIIFSATLIIGVIVYSWFNRDSDRVILTLVTAMTIGALGFITKESISNKIEKISKEFPIVVFFGLPDYMPLQIKLPYDHELAMCLQEIKKNNIPSDSENIDISYGSEKYFDAIQYLIVKEIFKGFYRSWNVVAKQTVTPVGKFLSRQPLGNTGKDIYIYEILGGFTDNYFVDQGVHKKVGDEFGGKAVFPPSIKFSAKTDDYKSKAIINLNTDFINISITLNNTIASAHIGEYNKLLGLDAPPQQPGKHLRDMISRPTKYGHSVFFLTVEAEQNMWLNGHPDMKMHRNWANSIIELLNNTFNYEEIREEHLRQFQLFGPKGVGSI